MNSYETLLGVAKRVGLEPERVQSYLESHAGRAEVAASQECAENLGISGVPFYVFDDTYGVSGAQPVEGFLDVFNRLTAAKEVSV